MQQDIDTKQWREVHNRVASEKENLPCGEAKSEPRPQPNRDSTERLGENEYTMNITQKQYDRAEAALQRRLGYNYS